MAKGKKKAHVDPLPIDNENDLQLEELDKEDNDELGGAQHAQILPKVCVFTLKHALATFVNAFVSVCYCY